MAYRFAVTTAVDKKQSQGNAAVLSIRLLALLGRIPDHAGNEEVHRLRTTVRRLEVQLGKCPPKIAKSLKNLRSKAGKVRDIDVHLGMLKPALFLKASVHRDAAPRPPEPSLDKLEDSRLGKKPGAPQDKLREKLRKKLIEILQAKRDCHLGSLRDVVAEAAPRLQSALPSLAERTTWSARGVQDVHQHAARARTLFLQWTRSVPEDAERLHRLRIHTKKLRYALEPLAEFPEAAELAAQLKRVQDAIGSWHDWATLLQLAERELRSPDAKPACAMLRARTGREYRKARHAAASVRTWMLGGKPAESAAGGNRSPQRTRKAG